MNATHIPVFDHAPQVAAEWLDELADNLGHGDQARAYQLLRETRHAVRDFMNPDEAADLAAQLPLLIRGIYYEGWNPSKTPVRPRGKADFLKRVTLRMPGQPITDPEHSVAAVFRLLRNRISAGEFDRIARTMRKPLRELWM